MDKNFGSVLVPSANVEQHRNTTGVGALAELPFKKVVVHPLVLLSVVDHFNRMGKIGNHKRVVGILLGAIKGKGILDISNSFARIYFYFFCLCQIDSFYSYSAF